ncbi:MAG: zf-HC2 domain-containing protein, partial [Spirochaetes bacterium]|nr:zf-HC2 domain-containing protein [Spirochaetota bacterium]
MVTMCPDRELLSAWADGEVPSPWRETIDRHVAACESCAR